MKQATSCTDSSDFPHRDPLLSEARRARHEQRLGLEDGEAAACFLCGLTDVDALVGVKASLFEGHHLFGRAIDPQAIRPMCRNCHAILTAANRDAGVSTARPATVLHQLLTAVQALCVLLIVAAKALLAMVDGVLGLVPRFDTEVPTWHDWAEAQR